MTTRRRFITGTAALTAYAALPAHGRLMINQLSGFGAGVGLATVSYTATADSTTNLTAYTFTAQLLGAEAADRKIVVAVGTAKSAPAPTINSVTIGGISATEIIGLTMGTEDRCGLWQADVPTGTTGDVVVTLSTGCLRCGIDIFRITDALAAAHDTGSSTADPSTDTLDIPANGVAIGFGSSGGGTGSKTWTNLTENSDRDVEASCTFSAASAAFETLQTGLSITCDHVGTFDREGFVIASFGPA